MVPEVREAFATAAVTALQEMASASAEAGLEHIAAMEGDVFAEIRLLRPMPGRLALAFPLATIEAIARRYLPAEAMTPELLADTAGELANVIAGQAKTMLQGTLHHFRLATPQMGRAEGMGEVLPIVGEVGGFLMRIELEPCAEG